MKVAIVTAAAELVIQCIFIVLPSRLGCSSRPGLNSLARGLFPPTRTQISRVLLFWAAFILTRPLGATVGDFLDKPYAHGGLALNRFYASAILLAAIVALIVILPQRAGRHPSAARANRSSVSTTAGRQI